MPISRCSYGELDTASVQGAIGGGLTDTVSARRRGALPVARRLDRQHFTGEERRDGRLRRARLAGTAAARADRVVQRCCSTSTAATTTAPHRSSAPTCSARAATASTRTTTATRSPTTRGDNNPQSAEGLGGSLRLDYDFDGDTTLTSITAYENTESSSLGDIDGGFGADFLPIRRALPAGQHAGRVPASRSRHTTRTASTTSTSSRRSSASRRRRGSSSSGRRASTTSTRSSP